MLEKGGVFPYQSWEENEENDLQFPTIRPTLQAGKKLSSPIVIAQAARQYWPILAPYLANIKYCM